MNSNTAGHSTQPNWWPKRWDGAMPQNPKATKTLTEFRATARDTGKDVKAPGWGRKRQQRAFGASAPCGWALVRGVLLHAALAVLLIAGATGSAMLVVWLLRAVLTVALKGVGVL
jgi:hypothetical protein